MGLAMGLQSNCRQNSCLPCRMVGAGGRGAAERQLEDRPFEEGKDFDKTKNAAKEMSWQSHECTPKPGVKPVFIT
jgi:hypothetical protein